MSTVKLTRSRVFLTLALATSIFACDAKPVSHALSKVSEPTVEFLSEEDMPFDPPPGGDLGYFPTSSGEAAVPKCPKGEVPFEGECHTIEKLTEISDFNDDAAINEVLHTEDCEKKAKASNRLIRTQEHAVDIVDAKLDAILENLKEEQAEQNALE